MEPCILIFMFLFGTLLLMWIVVSVPARERLASSNMIAFRITSVQHAVLLSTALPCFLIAWGCQAIKYLWEGFQSLGISVRSLCKATMRACVRKWCRLRHRHQPTRSLDQNDLEISSVTSRTQFNRLTHPPLLQIPTELREIIIRMSVVHYDILDCRPTILLRPRKQFRDAMAFIRTCRQIYREGHPIVFGSTLFHIWTRNPFYRQLKAQVWNEFTMIHLAAQLNSQRTSRLSAAIRDLSNMFGLRDIYLSIWDYVDFENNETAISGVFGPLRIRLKNLSLVQINLICPRARNPRAENRLKTLIAATKGFWPVGCEYGILRSLQGPVTKWRALIRLQGYEPKRAIGLDEDLVPLPWDGDHV